MDKPIGQSALPCLPPTEVWSVPPEVCGYPVQVRGPVRVGTPLPPPTAARALLVVQQHVQVDANAGTGHCHGQRQVANESVDEPNEFSE